jgi:hypothetical protein
MPTLQKDRYYKTILINKHAISYKEKLYTHAPWKNVPWKICNKNDEYRTTVSENLDPWAVSD